jgi:hypothetical protein
MNNEKMNQIIDEAYDNYLKNFVTPICPPNLDVQPDYYMPMTQEWFVNSAKERGLRGEEFSQKWGLRIEERELSFKERRDLAYHYAIKNNKFPLCIDAYGVNGIPKYMETINNTGWDIPTRLITITYNNETIESYE